MVTKKIQSILGTLSQNMMGMSLLQQRGESRFVSYNLSAAKTLDLLLLRIVLISLVATYISDIRSQTLEATYVAKTCIFCSLCLNLKTFQRNISTCYDEIIIGSCVLILDSSPTSVVDFKRKSPPAKMIFKAFKLNCQTLFCYPT